MNVLIITFSLLSVFSASGFSYKILAVFPHEGKSHLGVFAPIIRQLVVRGHEMTVISHYGFNVQNEGYKEILLGDMNKRGGDFFDLNSFKNMPNGLLEINQAIILTKMGYNACDMLFSNQKVKDLIKSDEKFDLIIGEFFNNECVLGFFDKYKIPLVGVMAHTLMPWQNDRFGNPDNPSYIPNNHLWYETKMNFFQRVVNTLGNFWYNSVYWWNISNQEGLVGKFLGKKNFKFDGLIRNISLLLVDSYFSLSFPRPLVPNVIEVGGIHIEKSKKLPENIEKFINESTHGVIYFSLGSMIKGHTFPQDKREEFLRAFARLPQRVLWKWENETMPGKPDNVMIQKWMPQFDILSHPNVKAFISHGGLLGTTEAVHCGVPMLVMPQYGDQHTNAKAIEANGGGVILYLKEATEEKVYENLKTILDPEFRAKAKALSERFRDRPMSPMDTAIYWVEYVARHKGAPHMRSAAVDMPLYQYLLLDVFAFLGAILLVFFYLSYKFISLIFKKLFAKKKVKLN